MKCPYCGGEVQNGERYCRACGGEIQLSQQIQPQAQQSEALSYPSPALQLPTNRGLLKTIPLCLITLGIYGTVMQSRISTEIKLVASRYDGRRTMPFLGMLMLAPLTLESTGLSGSTSLQTAWERSCTAGTIPIPLALPPSGCGRCWEA